MDSRQSRILWAALAVVAISVSAVAHRENSVATQQSPRTAPLFEFHSNFWVNLHQVLFHEALLRAGKPDRRLQSNVPLSAARMTEMENEDWNTALDFYTERIVGLRQLFDGDLVRINDQLAVLPDNPVNLNPVALPPGMEVILKMAAPVYRKYWWPAQNAANEQWIASQSLRVKELGPQIAGAIQRDLHQQWPKAPLRVDVSYYVPEIGHAYTTDDPPHTTFSSSGTQLQDLSGFETLFHEASHSFADTVTNALFAECETEKKNCGDLWHAVLFYTAGVEVRRALPPADEQNFIPYAYKYGLYNRGDYPRYRSVLEADWQKYLDGKIDFATAIHSMAADLQQ
ncbi:MAG: hypothetical protein WBE21_01885 [Candidatus Acidiferrales bacterium]